MSFPERFMLTLLEAYSDKSHSESLIRIRALGYCKAIFEVMIGEITNDKNKLDIGLHALKRMFPS